MPDECSEVDGTITLVWRLRFLSRFGRCVDGGDRPDLLIRHRPHTAQRRLAIGVLERTLGAGQCVL
jgi:hypothetical protein